ncbi:MAG: hypothetical protein M0Q13_15045 [Methanothrix sp.]|jgi:DNA polymerase-1|nr:hypothetical protein [Methanothrix sp.]
MNNRALIIDGNNFYNIAYYSAKKKGNDQYVAIRFFEKIAEAYDVYKNEFKFLFIVWDSLNNDRKNENKEYKANRKEKPEDFYNMMPYIVDTLIMREIQQYKIDGFEGDDIIYSIVEMCKLKNYSITVASADHDMYQLIDTYINIYDPYDKKIVDYKKFIELYTIKPNQWKYVKALMGDVSDNIKGVKGIGEKNAIKLIYEYSDLDKFYSSNMDKVSKNVKKLMTIVDGDYNAKESAYNSLNMVNFRKIELPYPEFAVINPIKVNKSLYMENYSDE